MKNENKQTIKRIVKLKSIITFGILTTIILLLAAACGEPPQAQEAKIVSVSPANNAKGIKNDVNIVITFSTSMDTTSTVSAYSSNSVGLKNNEVSFSWNSDTTVLTIKPDKALAYGWFRNQFIVEPQKFGELEPIEYAFRIATSAKSSSGTALNKEFESSFFSLRKRDKYQLTSNVDADVRSDGLVGGCSGSDQQNIAMCVGESGLKGHPFYRSFIGFDLSSLPADIEIFSAELSIHQFKINGHPYSKHGAIRVEHINFGDQIDKNDFDTSVLDYIGQFSGSVIPHFHYMFVTKTLKKDLADRANNNNRSQYRLRFSDENSTGSGNVAFFYTSDYSKRLLKPYIAILDLVP